MSLAVYHPLTGHAIPGVRDLLERCDFEASKVLELARRLADYRLALHAQARQILAPIHAEPWTEAAMPWRNPPASLLSADLMRALLGTQSQALRHLALAGNDLAPTFDEAVMRWTAVVATLPLSNKISSLEQCWGKRWALHMRHDPDLHITLPVLVASIAEDLAVFSEPYVKGEIPHGESVSNILDALRKLNIPLFSSIPPAYYDRHEGLAALDTLLATYRGVVLTGEDGSGRSSLLFAWFARIVFERKPEWANGFRFCSTRIPGMGSARGDWHKDLTAFDKDNERYLLGLSHEKDFSVDETRMVTSFALSKPYRFRVALMLDPQEARDFADKIPEIRSFPDVPVPKMTDLDVIPMWLCQAPDSEDAKGYRVTLAKILSLLESEFSPTSDAWQIPSRNRIGMYDWSGYRKTAADLQANWDFHVKCIKKTPASTIKLTPPQEKIIRRFAGDLDRLRELAQLEDLIP